MIEIKRKEDCCGCHACQNICPKKCISMHEDAEGFLYPKTDETSCINCHLCEKVCPIINKNEEFIGRDFLTTPLVYAGRRRTDEDVLLSASGGAFSVFAEQVIREGGIVFGARWDENFTRVFHDYTETLEGLNAFRGSKYIQSEIGKTYLQAEIFLKLGRKVLFSGVLCQIAGFRRFLKKEYPNLLLVSILCHSVPPAKVWKIFRDDLLSKSKIQFLDSIVMRKRLKIFKKKYFEANLQIVSGKNQRNIPLYQTWYGRGFLDCVYSRPSCHECPAKGLTSGCDIQLGDFWGIEKFYPNLDINSGISLIIVETNKGNIFLDQVKSQFGILLSSVYDDACVANSALEKAFPPSVKRNEFFSILNTASSSEEICDRLRGIFPVTLKMKIKFFLKKIILSVGKYS